MYVLHSLLAPFFTFPHVDVVLFGPNSTKTILHFRARSLNKNLFAHKQMHEHMHAGYCSYTHTHTYLFVHADVCSYVLMNVC